MTSLRQQMQQLVRELEETVCAIDRPICLMEICGTHTVSACRSGVHSLMPPNIRLISGPGCPVCVTAQRYIDALISLGREPDVTLVTYGDMLRVTGAGQSLEIARSEGADVRVVTCSMDVLDIARAEPGREVVFAAVGFETTAPATAAMVRAAYAAEFTNLSILCAHKLVVPALLALLQDPEICVDGFLCPGHVSVIIGANAYRPVVERHRKPCAIAGFEPLQIMEGIVHLARQIQTGEPGLENLYPEVVRSEGNVTAQRLLREVFAVGDSVWRMLGVLPGSGLHLRRKYSAFDAVQRFGIEWGADHEAPGCRCGEVITGKSAPGDCPLFATVCTPTDPIGPCMVSSEGTCQAWFKYRRAEIGRTRQKPLRETMT